MSQKPGEQRASKRDTKGTKMRIGVNCAQPVPSQHQQSARIRKLVVVT